MTDISLKQLEVFVAVVEYGGFTRAAEELFLNQSTVSTHIRTLEGTLGKELFLRANRRNVCLTPEGEQVYSLAKRILGDCDALCALFAREESFPSEPLGASTVPGQYLLPDYLSAYLRRQKQFRYSLKRGDSEQVHQMLRSGEIRIGFVGAVSDPEAVDYHTLAQDKLVMVTPNTPHYRNLLASGAYGRDLLGEPTVAREEGSGTDRTVLSYIQHLGFAREKLNIVARMDDPESIKRMVAQGAGVSILSALAVEKEVRDGTLLSFEMDRTVLKRDIYLITLRSNHYSQSEQHFISFLKDYAHRKT